MKKRLLSILTLSYLMLLVPACDLQEANVNPNAPSDAPSSVTLTGAQGVLAFNLGIDAGLLSATVMQQAAGANGDATANDNYTAIPGRFNNFWVNFYSNVLQELDIIVQKGQATNAPYYSGIARVLSAFTYGTLTDSFGDIPFSQALRGTGNTAPVYDSQEQVYAGIQATLDTAIAELSQPAGSFATAPPGADDLVFKGNAQQWLAVAWTLKARYALHLSKLDPDAAAKALSYLYEGAPNGKYRGIASNAGDAQVVFGAAQTNANPFYQQNTSRPGWVGLGAAFVNLLNGNKATDPSTKEPAAVPDPRRAYLATPYPVGSGKYRGGVAGVPGAYSLIGSYYGAATSPVVLVSYAEAKFIEAEARLRLNPADPKIQVVLTEAVNASFNKIIPAGDANGATEKREAYLAAKATLTGEAEADLEKIITQKYLALFLQPEPWVDYRRTGFPRLPLAANATHSLNPNGQIPRRFPYPQNEQSLNKSLPGASTYQEPRLWWDKL